MSEFLGHGIYTVSEAGRLLGLRTARITEWFKSKRAPSVFQGDYSVLESQTALSFHDLIDALVATKLRGRGVSLQTIRKAFNHMASDFNTPHPFCHKELLTDGEQIFIRTFGSDGEERIMHAIGHQRLFPKIILPYLKQLDYDSKSKLALRWNIGERVCIDPQVCLGKPIVKKVGIPTRILSEEYKANNQDARLVAMWYNVSSNDVKAAYQFECKLAA